jgi:hypothetical protein
LTCVVSLQGQLGDHLKAVPERVSHATAAAGADQDADAVSADASEQGNITGSSEYRFFLHRHWSLLDAMQHSPYIAAKLSVWNAKGVSKLNVSGLRKCFFVSHINSHRNYWLGLVFHWHSANSISSL